MRPEARDTALLWDMLRHARDVVVFTKDKTFAEYQTDTMLRRAVEHTVQIIGEAANKVSKPYRESDPEIPWALIHQAAAQAGPRLRNY